MLNHDDANVINSTELIPLTNTDEGATAVMGRDLHAFLEVTTPYHIWMPRMIEYGFTAGQDFMNKNVQNPTGGRPRLDHIVSLDMAKEVAMIQRTEKGKRARRYFIEVEKQHRAQAPAVPRTYSEALRAAADAADRANALEAKVEEDAPKVDYHDRFVAADDDVVTISDWGAHYGLTRPQTFELLREKRIIYRKTVTQEFSAKRGEVTDRDEWRVYSGHRNMFELRAQHNAPRYHNGQVRQTLYVKAAAGFMLATQVGLEDLASPLFDRGQIGLGAE